MSEATTKSIDREQILSQFCEELRSFIRTFQAFHANVQKADPVYDCEGHEESFVQGIALIVARAYKRANGDMNIESRIRRELREEWKNQIDLIPFPYEGRDAESALKYAETMTEIDRQVASALSSGSIQDEKYEVMMRELQESLTVVRKRLHEQFPERYIEPEDSESKA
jgi:hypothetical protein